MFRDDSLLYIQIPNIKLKKINWEWEFKQQNGMYNWFWNEILEKIQVNLYDAILKPSRFVFRLTCAIETKLGSSFPLARFNF